MRDGLDLSGLGWGPVAGFCEHGEEICFKNAGFC
jgi:hypothetical protein